MKKSLLFCISMLMMALAVAGPVDSQQASQVALHFMMQKSSAITRGSSCQLVYTQTNERSADALFYVFNVGEGFVMVSADDAVVPVLGYSPSGHFNPDRIPDNFRAWVQGYADAIEYAKTHELVADAAVQEQWEALEAGRALRGGGTRNTVGPLLTTKWDQDIPYNNLCPIDSDDDWVGHVPTGCVATAMAQIINYHEYPAHGFGTHQYYNDRYGLQQADFANTTYQYNLMPDTFDYYAPIDPAQANAVATLMYNCGVAVNMDYDTYSSGAFTEAARAALVTHFGYETQDALKSRRYQAHSSMTGLSYWTTSTYYTDDEWVVLLISELNENRPILYTGGGGDEGSAHAWVCDGYDNDTLFHFNWGWGGFEDGYFRIGDDFGFTNNNDIIFLRPGNGISDTVLLNMKGKTSATVSGSMLVGHTRAFRDGGYETYSWNNSCNDTLTLTASTPGAQLWVEVVSYIRQTATVYDGNATSGTPLLTVNANATPVMSTSDTITIVYSGSLEILGFVLRVSEVTCFPFVNNFTCTHRDHSTADFSWNVLSAGNYSNHNFNWQLEYGLHGFTPGTGTRMHPTGTTASIGGLTADTDYDAYLTYTCEGGQTITRGPVSFKTSLLMECLDGVVPTNQYTESSADAGAFSSTNGDYYGHWSQQIYTAAELSAIGLGAGDALAALKVHYKQGLPDASKTRNIAIYMGNTSVEDFSNTNGWMPINSMTNVFTYKPVIFSNIEDEEWGTFDFDNPFVWDGHSNVVVTFADSGQTLVGMGNNGNYSRYLQIYHANDPESNKLIYRSVALADFNPTVLPDIYSTPYYSGRPIMGFCLQESCVRPSHVTCTSLNRHSVQVEWLPGYQETTWNVEYGPANFEQGTGTSLTVNGNPRLLLTQLPTGLYDLYVQADCGGQTSRWVKTSFGLGSFDCAQIGEGTTTNSIFPMGYYSSWYYSYTQQIFTAAELEAQGVNGDIHSIAFQYGGTMQTKSLVQVFLGNTTQPNMVSPNGWIPSSDLQEVFNGSVTLQNGWTTIQFDTPFAWDGNSNLVVAILNNSGTENGSFVSYMHSTSENMALERTSSSPVSMDNGDITRYSIRNNMRFCGTGEGCTLRRDMEASIIEGETYNFYGTLLSEPGTYKHRWWVSDECDSLVTLNLKMRKVIFVTTTGSGTHDGTSWANAMELQEAMDTAITFTDRTPYLYVKKGTYTGNTSAQNSFEIKANVRAYGGFNGNEPANYDLNNRTQANMNQTILFGSNARRVLYQSTDFTENNATVFDGFMIRGGTVNTAGEGGGAYIRKYCTLQNCTFTANNAAISGSESSIYRRGIAVYNNGGTIDNCQIYSNTITLSGTGSSYYVYGVGVYNNNGTIRNSDIYNNTVNYSGNIGSGWNVYGGGIYDNGSGNIHHNQITRNSAVNGGGIYLNNRATVEYCVISNNTTRGNGGGIFLYNTPSSVFSHCLISNNNAGGTGGGVYDSYAKATFIHCDIVRNSAVTNAGGLYTGSGTTLKNSIVWGNKVGANHNQMASNSNYFTCMNSAVQGGYSGAIALEAENSGTGVGYPMFANPTAEAGADANNAIGDWTLLNGSVCANMGNDDFVSKETDLGGNARIQQGRVDIGAYESAFGIAYALHPQAESNIIYVTTTGAGTQDGSSWGNATSNLQYAMDIAMGCNPPAAVWVKQGTYTPGKPLIAQPKVAVYGGFAGNEPYTYDLTQRNFTTHTTIIDGDSAYRVLTQSCPFVSSQISSGSISYSEPATILMPTSGTLDVTACSGTIYDNGGPSNNYSNNCDGEIILRSFNPNSVITLTGTIDVESYYSDRLEIYDYDDGETDYLGEYSSSGSISLISNSSAILLKFTSDGSINRDGFAIDFTCSDCTPVIPTVEEPLFRIGESLFDGFTFQNGFVSGTSDYAGAYLMDNIDMLNCKFSNNHRRGVYASGSHFDNCLFDGNKGYGLYTAGATNVDNSIAQNNNDYGIYFNSTGTMTGCTLQNNYGGLYIYKGTATNCTVTGNGGSGEYYGIRGDNNAQVINTTVMNNTCCGVYAYGGLYMDVNIANNTKSRQGTSSSKVYAGVYAQNNAHFINCNIVNNKIELIPNSWGEVNRTNAFAGVYNYSTNNEYTNCIIWGNKADTAVSNIEREGTFSYCAVEGGVSGSANITLEAANTGSSSNASYVRFVNPTASAGVSTQSNVDWNLNNGSACINVGNPNTTALNLPTYDLGGSLRIKQQHVDIGAYEYGNVTYQTINYSICLGESFFYGDYFLYPEEPGMFRDTFIYNEGGLDYIAYINLKVNPVYNESLNVSICEGDSYTFNGQSYNTNCTQTAYLQTASGCDSTVVLNLTVNPTVYSQVYVSDCDSHTWNGQTYTTSGDKVQTLTSSTGCDSVVTMHLTLYQSKSSVDYKTVCRSGLPYVYHNLFFDTDTPNDTVATCTLRTIHGCDSVVTLHLHIVDVIASEFSATACDSYTWNNTTYTTSGDKVKTFTSASGCDSVVTLHLTIKHSVASTISVTECDSYTWNDNIYTESGTYQQTFTAANGCDSVVTLNLTINHSVTEPIEFTICENDLPYHYINGQIDTTFEENTPNLSTLNFKLSTIHGCDSTVVLSLTVVPAYTPVISVSGALTPCESSSATLSVAGNYSAYEWSNGAATPSITITEPGYYWVTVTDVNGCTGSSEMTHVGISQLITETPSICMVGVENGHNLVIWDELSDPDVKFYKLYRENNQANVFEPLAMISADGVNAYEDVTADPAVRAYRYKITAVDSCGGETAMSPYHKSVHLTINQGIGNSWNLIWSDYEGFEFASYKLYRGTANNNLQLIQTMPSNLNSYTDYLSSMDEALFYQIEVVLPEDHNCVRHTRDITYTGSRSNMVYNGVPVAVDITESACDSYEWLGQTLTQSGTYTGTYTSELGYECNATLHLTINHAQPMSFERTGCDSYTPTWADGYSTTYTQSGTYTHGYENADGCWQVDTLHLTIRHAPQVSLGVRDWPSMSPISSEITSGQEIAIINMMHQDGYTYVWSNGEAGEMAGIVVSPTTATTYSVTVSNQPCTSTAQDNITIMITGIEDYEQSGVTLYPNPTSSIVNVEFEMGNEQWRDVKIQVFDMYGKRLRMVPVEASTTQVDLSMFADGVYTLRIETPTGILTRKIVKQGQ